MDGKYTTHSVEETLALAKRLGASLEGGRTVALIGELGAGKTTFVRGLAQGLGVDDPAAVKSPSYTLVISYPGRVPLYHIDAYFMHTDEDLELCGVEDALETGHVVVIEWADRIQPLLPERIISVRLEAAGLDERMIRIDSLTPDMDK